MAVMSLVTRSLVVAAAIVALVLLPLTISFAQTPSPAGKAAPLTEADRAFINKVAAGGRAEVELGQLAERKGTDDAVKSFGRRMAEEHGKANRELADLATRKGLRVSPDSSKADGLRQRLSNLSGREFDREYVREMVKDHRQDVAEFRRMSQRAADPDLRAWVTRTLPALEEHLRLIEGLQNRVSAALV